MKKRLVVCCDGTWNRPDAANVTNIEKIARTISTDLTDDGVQQQVLYLSGVGTSGYLVDAWLGGAFGMGLFNSVRAGYRWLALNYAPGDDIFVFGFSRGAYTARSLVGMIGRVGLLTRQSLVSEHLPDAVARYRRSRPGTTSSQDASDAHFKATLSHPDLTITFVGVFDTVGALGVPGAFRREHQFHDVRLGNQVLCARQALALDEHRMKFEPSLWAPPLQAGGEGPGVHPQDPRVKQVWFEGAHSDVGGGYPETGLSDTALGWMTAEASAQGLVFDDSLLDQYLGSGSHATRHDSLHGIYKAMNLGSRIRLAMRHSADPPYVGHDRVLARLHAVSVRIASSAAQHFADDPADVPYHPKNLVTYDEATDSFTGCTETVEGRPLG